VKDTGSTRDQWEALDGMGAHRSRLVTAQEKVTGGGADERSPTEKVWT
jgi:hypothetical protein